MLRLFQNDPLIPGRSVLLGGIARMVRSTSADLFAAFLGVPGTAPAQVADGISQSLAQSGIPALSSDQRQSLAVRIIGDCVRCWHDASRGLDRAPSVAQSAGVTSATLSDRVDKGAELDRVGRAITIASEEADDARLVLGAWQAEAEARVRTKLLNDLGDETIPLDQRRHLLVDAGELIAAEADLLAAAQQLKAQNQGALDALSSDVADSEADTLLLRTLRTLQSGQIPSSADLYAAAQRFSQRGGTVPETAAPPPAVKTPAAPAPAKKLTAKKPKAKPKATKGQKRSQPR